MCLRLWCNGSRVTISRRSALSSLSPSVYILLGTFFEEMSSILITLPLILPIVVSLGYDPLWWGVICLIQVEMALIHPPMGIIVFLLHAIAPKISDVHNLPRRGSISDRRFRRADHPDFASRYCSVAAAGTCTKAQIRNRTDAPLSRVIAVPNGTLANRGFDALRNRAQRRQELTLGFGDGQCRRNPYQRQAAQYPRPGPDRDRHAGRFRVDFAILNGKTLGTDGIEKRADARLARGRLWSSRLGERASISRIARRSLAEQKAR